MKWIQRFAVIASTFATFGVVAAAQSASIPIGKNGDVELIEAVTVGPTVLQPGHYRFKHTVQNGQHYLLVGRQQTVASTAPSRHSGAGGSLEVARIPCQLVQLDGKAKQTELHTRTQPDGSRLLTQIRIEGEGAGHLLTLEPQG
jgi:hypothetical protein